jgi:phosphinothricin acetyltransferase
MIIRTMRQQDAGAVLAIYGEGIDDRMATFETRCPSWKEWDTNHLKECRLVAEVEGEVVGWGALNAVSKRACYGGVAEVSIYVARMARGRGVGSALLEALVNTSEKAGYWTLQGTTFEDNVPSLRLQNKCGFRTVGLRERIGQLDGQWKSTVIMERRSRAVGK